MNLTKPQPIAGTHPTSEGKPRKRASRTDLARAVREVTIYMYDGEWYRKAFVKCICQEYGVTFDEVATICGIADDDSGRWVCSIRK